MFYARFIVPARITIAKRELRVSTVSKDARTAVVRARMLRVLFDSMLCETGITVQQVSNVLKNAMATFKKPDAMPFNAVRDANGNWSFTDIKETDIESIDKFLEVVSKHETTSLKNVAIAPDPEKKKLNLSLEELVSEFISYETQRATDGALKQKSVDAMTAKLKVFISYCEKTAVEDFTPEYLDKYILQLRYYPMRRDVFKIYPNMSFAEVISKSKAGTLLTQAGEKFQCLSDLTIEGYKIAVINFLFFLEKKMILSPIVRATFSDKKAKKKIISTEREAFSDKELKLIFENRFYKQAYYNTPYQYWVPLVGLFTGARLNEISQLSTKDIREVDGIYIFDFNDADEKELKNIQSIRSMPVHPKLIEMGLIEHWKEKSKEGDVNLFETGKGKKDGYGKNPGQWFNQKYLREIVGIDSPTKVFHCFRHTFITRMHNEIVKNAMNPHIQHSVENFPTGLMLKRMVGHSIASTLAGAKSRGSTHTDVYVGEFEPKLMLELISKLDLNIVQFTKYERILNYKVMPKIECLDFLFN